MQNICILGSTGSVGTQTLDIISEYPEQFRAYALTANCSHQKLLEQCLLFQPKFVHLADAEAAKFLKQQIPPGITVLDTPEQLLMLMSDPHIDQVMAAMSGSCGLLPVLTALKAKKTVLLANKEPIVMAGRWVLDLISKGYGKLIPVDSEHNSIYQVLGQNYTIGQTISNLEKIILTASGGPFWRLPVSELASVTVEQALQHPTWSMGPKITIDSATLINKALELIEAKWLFQLAPHQLDVLIHPQSIVHSFVVFQDGAQLAQMGVPDMRLCISYALDPMRNLKIVPRLDLVGKSLEFFQAPLTKFRALKLAFDVIQAGNEASCIFNAANEIAVTQFLHGNIKFTDIFRFIEFCLDKYTVKTCGTIDEIIELDNQFRKNCIRDLQHVYAY